MRIVLLAVLMWMAGLVPALAEGFPRTQAEVASAGGARHVFAVELASTPEQLARGLMWRKSLAADAGMLFDFGRTRTVSMWMKNTLIPLDMVFIAEDGRIVGVAERTVPLSLEVISSPEPVRAVLEVNGGTVSRLGIRAGDRLVSPTFTPAAK